MKKIITACFVFMFLLAVVAGCPDKSGEKKQGEGGSTPVAIDFNDNDNDFMLSSDESFGE